ncbi:uncharacterized protein PRCAT00001352001 [Priceomyces carsonii]|uniref:uncharacterized protein n=1 Tax=Priceomyces carsonii TaxID=28549 RepID=UPI002ED92F64|nr:unnamed protein product [Priceomyces carsonii]
MSNEIEVASTDSNDYTNGGLSLGNLSPGKNVDSDINMKDEGRATEIANNEMNEVTEDGDDSDFGSFDEASYDEDIDMGESGIKDLTYEDRIRFSEGTSDDSNFEANIARLVDKLFSGIKAIDSNTGINEDLIFDKSSQMLYDLSTLPRLKPPNWTRLSIRHNLLIKLGIPINLDELEPGITLEPTHIIQRRKRTITEEDIDWSGFSIPDISSLHISNDDKRNYIELTPEILSKIETDSLNNSSIQFLQEIKNEELLDEKLNQFKKNYDELTTLSLIWNDHLKELTKNFEIYESVVQNFIGYSQRLRREEIFENLERVKHKHRFKNKRH